jgi:hypothetical protein
VPEEPSPQPREPRWKGELRFWVPTATGLIALVALGFAGLGSVGSLLGLSSTDELPAPRLEVHQASPINRPDVYEADVAAPLQTRPSTPQVAVTVRNRGKEAALLERVRVTIEDSARLPICPYVGAAGPVPGYQHFYPIKLPWLPAPDERVVQHEMHQEVPAGKAGDFTFYFRVPSDFAAAHLYALRLEVIVDGAERPFDLGHFVVGVPGPVPRTGFYLPESEDLLVDTYEAERTPGSALALATSWCYRRNLAEMRRVLARPGRRAPAIAALAEVRLVRGWPWLGDSRPARAAIEPLLATEPLQGPVLAVFAAERTGDAQLVEWTRRRAVTQLSSWARRDISHGFVEDWTLAYARAAYEFAPSPKARELIRAVEARRQGAEESLVNGPR